MKLLKRLQTPLAAFALLVLVTVPALAAPSRQDRSDEFSKRFARAMSINDQDEMAKLVRTYQGEAVVRTDELSTQIATETSEALEREVDLLNKAWQVAVKTKFVERHYTYLSLIKPAAFRERERLRKAYLIQNAKYFENLAGAKDGPIFERVAGELKAVAGAFEEVGAFYLAGEAWMLYGMCFDGQQRGKKEDKRKVTEGFGKMVETWDRIELQHSQYIRVRQVYDRLVAEGWAEALADPNAPAPGAPKAAADTTSIALGFEAIEEWDAYERPSYFMDEMYQMWPAVPLQGKGSAGSFAGLEQGPHVLRSSSSAFELDFNRDGTGEAEVKLTGKQEVVECDIVDGGAPRKWAFYMATGQQQDVYQGLQLNLLPDDLQLSLFYISAASMVGTLAGQPVRIIDDNADGIYGSPPKAYAYPGLSAELFHPLLDSVVLGSSKRAVPWSEFLQVGEQWYRMESANSGTVLNATPMEVETGTLKLEYKGPPPVWMIVRGEAGLENSFFDLLANGKRGVEVPRGSYELYVGLVAKGKKQEVAKALILPGHKTPKWTVEAGKETVVKLGAPFGFSFLTNKSGEEVTVVGRTVTIVGSAGERYERAWNCAPRPLASVRKQGAKRGSKPERLDRVLDLNEMKEGVLVYDYYDVWGPLDTALVWKKDDPYQVQLVEKKNRLFGKIESEWR